MIFENMKKKPKLFSPNLRFMNIHHMLSDFLPASCSEFAKITDEGISDFLVVVREI